MFDDRSSFFTGFSDDGDTDIFGNKKDDGFGFAPPSKPAPPEHYPGEPVPVAKGFCPKAGVPCSHMGPAGCELSECDEYEKNGRQFQVFGLLNGWFD
ncbi:MAG: hypothetical protein II808_04120 [Clostridia bacterium]|nr:hypothetical protein [Clostridia bacterium]